MPWLHGSTVHVSGRAMADPEFVLSKRSNAILDALVITSVTAMAAVIWQMNVTLTKLQAKIENDAPKVSREIYDLDLKQVNRELADHEARLKSAERAILSRNQH